MGKRISAKSSIHDELAKENEEKAGKNLPQLNVLPIAARFPLRFLLWHWNQSDGIRYGSAILIGHLDVASAAGGKIVTAVEIPPAAVLLLVHIYGCACSSSMTDGKRHAGCAVAMRHPPDIDVIVSSAGIDGVQR